MELTQRGVTLTELVIAVALTAVILAAMAPLTANWFGRGQQSASHCTVINALSMTRSLALRNPAANPALPAAVLCTTAQAVNLYRGDTLPANCPTVQDSRAQWSSLAPSNAPFVSSTACYALDSSGLPTTLPAIGGIACDSTLETRLTQDPGYANCRFK